MAIYEIPRQQWPDFSARFGRDHRGEVTTIQVSGPDQQRQELAHELPLLGLTADLGKDGTDSISVIVGDGRDKELTHTITGVQHVRLRENTSDWPGVEIETADGGKTEVRISGVVKL